MTTTQPGLDNPETVDEGAPDTPGPWSNLTSARAAGLVFAAAIAVSVPVILWFGRDQWFFLDEWSFLADRPLPSLDGMLDDHNGHWVTLPLLAYRTLFEIFGVTTYLPYQLLVLTTHLVVVALVRQVMRHLGVGPWIATAVALALLLFGTGFGNVLFGFQITLNGSVLCGLAALLLVDHDGRFDRRDWFALTLLVIGLTTSAVMVPMVIGVGVLALMTRGVRVAAVHTLVPGGVFLAWYLAYGSDAATESASIGSTVEFAFRMTVGVFEGLARNPFGAAVIAGVAVIGVADAVVAARSTGDRHRLAITAALLTSWTAFAILTAISRAAADAGASAATAGRYMHVGTALLLPLVGLGAQALWSRRAVLVAVPLVALAFGVPGNVVDLRDRPPFSLGNEASMVAVAASEFLVSVPGSSHPLGVFSPDAAWIRTARADGHIADADDLSAEALLSADLQLVTVQMPGAVPCAPTRSEPQDVVVDRGTRIGFDDAIVVTISGTDGASASKRFEATAGPVVEILAGPVDLEIDGSAGAAPTICLTP